jgi:hypothetical protein
MEPNSTPPNLPRPRTLPGAIWSLVLGILSLTCFSILTGIPAVICGHIAHAKIKRSCGSLTGDGLALAGLITGYLSILFLVVFVPLLAAIAIPNFVRAREMAQRNVCVYNLEQIDAATKSWALDKKKPDGAPVTLEDIRPYLKQRPVCPKGGTYTVGPVSEKPTCSIPGHELPQR